MSQQLPSVYRLRQAREILFTAIIWAFTGLLYAILFIFFAALADYWGLPVNPLFMAGILAGTFGALIYSSLRLAVLMAALVSPICIFYFIMISGVDSSVAGPFIPALQWILDALPGSIAGGMLGAGLAGAVASLIWTNPQNF